MTKMTMTNMAPLMTYKLVLIPRLADNWKLSPVPAIRGAAMQMKLCKVNPQTNLLLACVAE
jgi:hypothetical protein